MFFAAGLLLFCIAAIVVPYSIYLPVISDAPEHWGQFGDYVGNMVGLVLTAATLVIALIATIYLPRRLDDQRARAERTKLTVELAQKMYNSEFMVQVTAPAWEAAVKWLYWEGADGDEYRYQVCQGFFLYEYPHFGSPEDANRAQGQNVIRFHPHFYPYDRAAQGASANIIEHLSEHQALGIWLQFWCSLQTLIANDLVDAELARKLFTEWYRSWLRFMLELRLTGDELRKNKLPREGCDRPGGTEPKPTHYDQVEALEKLLFAGEVDDYSTVAKKAQTRANEIARKILDRPSS